MSRCQAGEGGERPFWGGGKRGPKVDKRNQKVASMGVSPREEDKGVQKLYREVGRPSPPRTQAHVKDGRVSLKQSGRGFRHSHDMSRKAFLKICFSLNLLKCSSRILRSKTFLIAFYCGKFQAKRRV